MQDTLMTKIKGKKAVVGVVGLGYVGLPLAVEKAKAGFVTIGFDVQDKKVDMVNEGVNYIGDIVPEELKTVIGSGKLRATKDFSFIKDVDCIAVCVPTPLDGYMQPDISDVVKTTKDIARFLEKGKLVVLESTTYPGTTREVIKPILESTGLKAGKDFFLAFSPERVDPGNKLYNVSNTPKVVGGVTPNCTEVAAAFYGNILGNGVCKVSSPEVAEMEKILENTYRNINIAMVNEMAIMCNKMGIDVWEVIDAASTKPYGFTPFYPGPGVGGHCIPIDPFYLTWKAREYGYHTRLIELAGEINNYMPEFVLERSMKILNRFGKALKGAKILVMGAAYKQDVDDIRQSPAVEVMKHLRRNGAVIKYNDPYIPALVIEGDELCSIQLTSEALHDADLVIIATKHSVYDYIFIQKNARFVFDTKNAMRDVKQRDNIERL